MALASLASLSMTAQNTILNNPDNTPYFGIRVGGEIFSFCCANVVQKWQKKIATDWYLISCDFVLLPWKDSNPHRRNQNPTCYHYTTRQFFIVLSPGVALFPFDSAKVGVIFELCKFFQSFFQKKWKKFSFWCFKAMISPASIMI